MDYGQKDMVEAIEDGRIVKVPESYAKREGLLILKKSPIQMQKQQPPAYLEKKEREKSSRTMPLTDYIRSTPDWKEKQVLSELVDNFNWQIRYSRRKLGLTRKQLARMINISEEELQILESGRLPSNDFILINKVQKALGINLRKDGKEFDISISELINKKPVAEEFYGQKSKKSDLSKDLIGKDIEILDDKI